nr:hypothetical protein [Tanacetum cinerariifolium]
MLAPGSYAQWKSRFMRYIDTNPNKELLRNLYNTTPEKRKLIDPEAEAVDMISNGIGESINIQDVKTKLFWEFGKFTSRDRESIESYYTRFYIMMNEMVRNQLKVETMQINVQLLQQLQQKWSRFVTIVKQKNDLVIALFDILKEHQNKVNEICAERIARNENPLALVATSQHYPDTYYQAPKPHKTHAPSSRHSTLTTTHATTKNKGKEIIKPHLPQFESASEEDSDEEQA